MRAATIAKECFVLFFLCLVLFRIAADFLFILHEMWCKNKAKTKKWTANIQWNVHRQVSNSTFTAGNFHVLCTNKIQITTCAHNVWQVEHTLQFGLLLLCVFFFICEIWNHILSIIIIVLNEYVSFYPSTHTHTHVCYVALWCAIYVDFIWHTNKQKPVLNQFYRFADHS